MPSGVRMLDARTGEERWHRYRYDWRYVEHDQSYFRGPDPGDWEDTNLITGHDGRIAAVNMMRRVEGDETEQENAETWVLDTASGTLLGEISGDRAVAVAGGLVLSTHEVYDGYDGGYREGSGRIVAREPSGDPRWEHPLPEDCELANAVATAGNLIVASVHCDTANTDTRPYLVALRADTGERAWRWDPPEDGRVTIRPSPREHRNLLLVHVRIGDNRNAEQSVFALDTGSGRPRWQRENVVLQPNGPREPNVDDLYWASIAWAGSTPVIAEIELTESRFVVTALDPSTGDTTWTRTMPEAWRVGYVMTQTPRLAGPVLGLPDGRLLVAGVRKPDVLDYQGLAITAIDAATGTTVSQAVLPQPMFEQRFRLLRTPVTVVAEYKGAAVALR
jgi:outer membrane protein assembly factor BamB